VPGQKQVDKLELELARIHCGDEATIGELKVDGAWECFTLEDTVRPPGVKVYGKTAIPPGRYRIIITWSNRFKKKLPLLLSVPNFEGVRVHSGNTAANTEGCILVGRSRSGDRMILNSRAAMKPLQEKIAKAIAEGREVWITIK
jgi:hypothetical protein